MRPALRWALAHPLHVLVAGLFAVLAIDCAMRPRRNRVPGCTWSLEVSIVTTVDGGDR